MSTDDPSFPPSEIELALRAGLPEPLRALVKEFPRNGWEENRNFSQLIAFWLHKHMSFRKLTDALETDALEMLDKGGNPDTYRQRLHRYASMLIGELHGHHQIEDAHYFPVLTKLDNVAAKGFDILETDHVQMDGFLSELTETANAVLTTKGDDKGFTDQVAGFKSSLDRFHPMLDRHLLDEEEIVVPVLLKYAPPEFR
tara:strand:- start:746 stop:1342 length:597 start_codon:yes stop_codon:yes gene_type:complete